MKVDGHFMFRTEDDPKWPWEQGGGINAGVILLKPCSKTFHQMISEVTSEVHPAHVPGSGPEQDYLSRFFAVSCTPWHSIGVPYNFQLHHVPYALDDVRRWRQFMAESGEDTVEAAEVEWLPARLRLSTEEIRNVHFSGVVKIWDMLLETSGVSPDGFTDHLLRSCCEDYGQWEEGAVLAEDASQDVADLVEGVYSRLQHVARLAVATWRGCADQLLARTPRLLDELLCPNQSATAWDP